MNLDKSTINFLKYLVNNHKIPRINFFEYCEEHNLSRWTTIQMFIFLKQNDYIMLKDDYIYPTYITEMLINYLNENKINSLYHNYILPYIHQFIIFLLGLLTPTLIKLLEHIIKILNI